MSKVIIMCTFMQSICGQIYFIEFPLIYFLYLNCHSMVYRTELKTVIAINVFVSKENVTMDVLF